MAKAARAGATSTAVTTDPPALLLDGSGSLSRRATMAKATRSGSTPHHRALPDEIVIWEVLVRLPPKALLRCRAVCRAWRSVTSTRGFLLAHHARQPVLPLLDNGNHINLINIGCFDHRPGVVAADQLHSVAFLKMSDDDCYSKLVASCDGLVIFCIDAIKFVICNPAIRQYAPLPLPPHQSWVLLGMYPHTPTGEYRLLLYSYDDPAPGIQVACHVLSLGSGKPPRHIGWPDAYNKLSEEPHMLFRGNLHWFESEISMIAVFDTTSEFFQEMCAPVVTNAADLFEMDGKLGIATFDSWTTIDIWELQDYDSVVWGWAFNYRIELSVAEIRLQCNNNDGLMRDIVVMPAGDGELHVMVKFAKCLHQVGMDGKLITTFHCKEEVDLTSYQLKQTLVSHTFFPTLEGYVVNAPPFM